MRAFGMLGETEYMVWRVHADSSGGREGGLSATSRVVAATLAQVAAPVSPIGPPTLTCNAVFFGKRGLMLPSTHAGDMRPSRIVKSPAVGARTYSGFSGPPFSMHVAQIHIIELYGQPSVEGHIVASEPRPLLRGENTARERVVTKQHPRVLSRATVLNMLCHVAPLELRPRNHTRSLLWIGCQDHQAWSPTHSQYVDFPSTPPWGV